MSRWPAKLALFTLAVLSAACLHPARAAQAPAANSAPAAPVAVFPISNLRPALANVQSAITGLSIGRWKAPNDTRNATLQDIASMQRDLTTTLPGLMTQAEAASSALSPSFAVFRNLDALYDVLLRVTETAALTGPASDASVLEEARASLEDARGKLGASLFQSISAQDAQIARQQAPPPHPAAAPQIPTKIVVHDGPDPTKPQKKKPVPAPQ